MAELIQGSALAGFYQLDENILNENRDRSRQSKINCTSVLVSAHPEIFPIKFLHTIPL